MKQNLPNNRLDYIVRKLSAVFFPAAFLILALSTQLRAQIVTTAAGNGSQAGTDNAPSFTNYYTGPATGTPLFRPMGVATDDSGNFYIADQVNNIIQKVTVATGIMTQVAGDGYGNGSTGGYSGDGGAATLAELYFPTGLAVDDSGNIYIADQVNNRIRKVTKTTGIITTYAGNGGGGYNGDNIQATAAELNQPFTVALDDSGNLYIADAGNARIREVSKRTNIIITLAGGGAGGGTDGAGDGTPATNAVFSSPDGLAVDDSGNVYIADQYDMVIRKITIANSDTITRIAGGQQGYSGNGGPATAAALWYPSGVAVDDSGNVYFADDWNDVIRKVNQRTGILTLYAGNNYNPWNVTYNNPPLGGYVNGPALSAEFAGPSGIALDPCGNLYEADYYNNVIREISAPASAPPVAAIKPSLPVICAGQPVSFSDTAIFNATKWQWSFPGAMPDTSTGKNPTGITYNTPGTYNVILIASNFCYTTAPDTLQLTVGMGAALTVVPPLQSVCNGESVTLNVTITGTNFTWSPAAGLSGTTGDTVVATPTASTRYTVSGTDSIGCQSTGSDSIAVIAVPPLIILPQSPQTVCPGQSITLMVPVSGSDYMWSPSATLSSSAGDTVIAAPLVQTTYTVTGKDSLGCLVSDTELISISNAPDTPTIIRSGDKLISSATQGNQWVRNDTVLQGATNQTYVATIRGAYQVIAENPANGCSATSAPFDLTGINRLMVESGQVTVYPNPTGGEINLNINSSAINVKDWYLQITDVLGRTLLTKPSLDYNNEIDLSNLPGGVYFICVVNKTGRVVMPVIRQ